MRKKYGLPNADAALRIVLSYAKGASASAEGKATLAKVVAGKEAKHQVEERTRKYSQGSYVVEAQHMAWLKEVTAKYGSDQTDVSHSVRALLDWAAEQPEGPIFTAEDNPYAYHDLTKRGTIVSHPILDANPITPSRK